MLVIWGGAKVDGSGDGGGEKDFAAQLAKGNSKAPDSLEDARAAVVVRAQAAIEVPRFRAVARQLLPAPLPPRGDWVGVGASRDDAAKRTVAREKLLGYGKLDFG